MRRTLVALAVAGAAALGTAAAVAESPRFERECGGRVDATCNYSFCGIVDCIVSDCVVFLDPVPGYNSGTCFGEARPRAGDPVES